jgi:hypothetical protein
MRLAFARTVVAATLVAVGQVAGTARPVIAQLAPESELNGHVLDAGGVGIPDQSVRLDG